MRPSPSGRPAPLVGLLVSLVGRCTLRPSIRSSPNGLCLRLREIWTLPCGRCLPPTCPRPRLRRICLSPSGLLVPLVGRCLRLRRIWMLPCGRCLPLPCPCPRLRRICLSSSGLLVPLVGRCPRLRRIWTLPCGRCLPPTCPRLRLRRICLPPSGLLAPRVGRCTLRPSIRSFSSGLCLRLRRMCTRRCAIGGTRARLAMPPWRNAVRRRPTDCCAA